MKKLLCSLLFFSACSSNTSSTARSEGDRTTSVHIVGSSTLYPLTQRAASDFASNRRHVRISVTGTTKGFADLCSKRASIVAASRLMNKVEKSECEKSKTSVIRFPIAFDAITLVVHADNTWAKYMTVSELRRIWSPESQGRLVNWNQIRAGFPDHPLVLFGPGRDSGTFDSFRERIVGRGAVLRRDYQSSEDDYLIVHEIVKTQGALGFIGLSYAQSNPKGLTIVAVGESPHDAVLPSVETVQSGSYKDLSRLTYLYTSPATLAEPDRRQFLEHYLQLAMTAGESLGFVPVSGQEFAASMARLSEVDDD